LVTDSSLAGVVLLHPVINKAVKAITAPEIK